jgi:hypothetical protein
MKNLEEKLRSALRVLERATSKNSAAKQTAIRWFNRLYYDLSTWNLELISFLQTYPGFRVSATDQEIEAFKDELAKRVNQVDFHAHNRYEYEFESDICLRINFLSARLQKDFSWLEKEDKKAYEELCSSVGKVIERPNRMFELSSTLARTIRELEYNIFGSRWSKEEKAPTLEQSGQVIQNYIQESNFLLDGIRQEAREIGFQLLSVDEYEEALLKEGSANPNLYVIGEVTMANEGDTYNVGQAGAVGRYARSDNDTFFQSEQKKALAEAANEIQNLIKQLEESNPTATEVEKIAHVNDETTPNFKRRVVGALQAGGETAIEEFLDNSYVNIGKAVVKGWMKPE